MSQKITAPGSYLCRVEKPSRFWLGNSTQKGTLFLRLPLVVKDATSDQNGASIAATYWFPEGNQEVCDSNAKRLAELFGWNADFAALENDEYGEPPDAVFVGRLCRAEVEIESYKGQERAVVKWLNRPDSMPQRGAEKSRLSAFLAKNQRRLLAIAAKENAARKAPAAVAQPAPPSPQPADLEEDEIPF